YRIWYLGAHRNLLLLDTASYGSCGCLGCHHCRCRRLLGRNVVQHSLFGLAESWRFGHASIHHSGLGPNLLAEERKPDCQLRRCRTKSRCRGAGRNLQVPGWYLLGSPTIRTGLARLDLLNRAWPILLVTPALPDFCQTFEAHFAAMSSLNC